MLLDLDVGVLECDINARVMVLVEPIRQRERRVLACLLANKRTLVTRKYLLFQAWQGRIVSDNSLSVALYQLRKILMRIDPDCRCFETIRNIGVVFLPERSELVPIESLEFCFSQFTFPPLHPCFLS